MKHSIALCALVLSWGLQPCSAAEDIEFVAEHLPEVAMDNRYASLPLWHTEAASEQAPRFEVQSAITRTRTGGLSIEGPMFSLAYNAVLRGTWRWGALAFYDPLQLDASSDERPLQTLFNPATPIARPAAAHFSHLDGRAIDLGGGVFVAHPREGRWLGRSIWTAGVLWQRVELRDYRLNYRIDSGPQIGMTGQIDFDATYRHIAPFLGTQFPHSMGNWQLSPHVLAVYPIPRRGTAGHITGPGFELSGNTEEMGNGKHFGDPSLTIGLTVLYEPAHISFDVGALLTQALLEPEIHRGIDRTYLFSFAWRP